MEYLMCFVMSSSIQVRGLLYNVLLNNSRGAEAVCDEAMLNRTCGDVESF